MFTGTSFPYKNIYGCGVPVHYQTTTLFYYTPAQLHPAQSLTFPWSSTPSQISAVQKHYTFLLLHAWSSITWYQQELGGNQAQYDTSVCCAAALAGVWLMAGDSTLWSGLFLYILFRWDNDAFQHDSGISVHVEINVHRQSWQKFMYQLAYFTRNASRLQDYLQPAAHREDHLQETLRGFGTCHTDLLVHLAFQMS